jgi:hypothetical protein
MCQTSARTVGRPRWGWLYAVMLPPLAALAVVEVATPPEVTRTVLRAALTLATLGGMAVWVRANRAAFDLQEWCACAPATITVRVIESRRSGAYVPPGADDPALTAVSEDSELILR